jgi:serine protease Do
MRRFLFLILVVALLSYGYHRWKQMSRPGGRRVAEQYTPVVGPKIDLKDVQVLAALDAEYVRLIDTIVPSVVSVSLRGISHQNPAFIDPFDFFFRGRRGQPSSRMKTSLGSGVIVSKEGHILTNYHVVEGTGDIDVQLTDGRVEAAQLIGSDEESDIALIKINGHDIVPLPLGDSDAVRVGQMVFAVGNPFGLHETVTQGIISAKGRRTMRDSSVEFLQTDAAVNKGNSGGPLLNLRGEIIGINSAIYSETGGWAGISFAIPSNTARRALESLIKTGRVVRTYLGVAMQDLTPELAQTLGLRDPRGALITDVLTGSPAEKAGLKRDDVIRKFNGRPVEDILALRSRVADVDPGTKIELTILRAGKEQTVSAEITEAPADFASARARVTPQSGSSPSPPSGDAPENVLSGIQVDEIPASLRERLPENVTGVCITQLQPNTDASSKLQPGDVIEEINREQVLAVDDFVRISRALQPGKTALLYIVRGRARRFVVISP